MTIMRWYVFTAFAGTLAITTAMTSPASLLGPVGSGLVAPASAQGLMGGGRGLGSGGTSGGVATPHGAGSGGATAGNNGSNGAASSGAATSTGPGPVNQNRFGGAFPANPPPDEPPAPPTSSAVMTLLNGENDQNAVALPGRCGTHPINGLGPRERMSGINLEFLKAAQIYLAPDFKPGRESTGLYLIADYQEELEKVRPDPTLAGTYLALVATRSVTGDMVTRTNAILCVTATTSLVADIVRSATADRRAERE